MRNSFFAFVSRAAIPAIVLASSLIFLPKAQGGLLVYEGFAYPPGGLSGQNGGQGWSETWRVTDSNGTVASPGLTYEDLPVVGNRAQLSAGSNASVYRGLDRIIGSSAGEIWMSFIGRVDAAIGVGYVGFYRGGDTSGFRTFLVGSASATDFLWGLLADSSSGSVTSATAVSGQTEVFLLVRLNYRTAGQLNAMDLWLNPVLDDPGSLGAPNATITAAQLGTKNYSFDRVRLFGSTGANAQFDEFRVGATFDSVTASKPSAPGAHEPHAVMIPPASPPQHTNTLPSLERLNSEQLGVRLYNQRRAFHAEGGSLTYVSVNDLVFGKGQGDNMIIWSRGPEDNLWHGVLIHPERKNTMVNVVPLENRPGETLISYVDRQHDAISINNRTVYLERIKGGSQIEEILSYSDGGSGVLNPVLVSYPEKNLAYWFLPDRTRPWRIRWFRMNTEDGTTQRLDDIPMPAAGARMYGFHREGNRAVFAVGMLANLYVLDVDLDAETYTLSPVDTASSPDNMPCREVDVHYYPELGFYVFTYLRPTHFSNRPRTGLLGEFVATTLDAKTLKPISKTVIGGYTAETAATHQVVSQKACERSFVSLYSTVDKVNQLHLTGRPENFVSTHLDRWEILPDGSIVQRMDNTMKPYTRMDLAMDRESNQLYMIVAETTDDFQLLLMTWKIEPLD